MNKTETSLHIQHKLAPSKSLVGDQTKLYAGMMENSILSIVTNETGALFRDPSFLIAISAIILAGIVRGFAGFGTGMIVVPVLAALYSPVTALVAIFVMDSWPNLPLVYKSRKQVDWAELRPVLLGIFFLMPLGIAFLKFGDAQTLRWFVSLLILLVVTLMISGWHYTGRRTAGVSFTVGGMCGFLGGSCGLTGPPAILYWMAKRTGAGIVRANMMMLLLLSELFAGIGLWVADLFTWKAVIMGALASPVYLVALLIGQSLFGIASEKTYRNIAIMLILIVAITASPALDGVLR